MSIAESDLATPPVEQRAAETESTWHLVVAAIGWLLLATVGVGFIVEFLGVFVTKVPLGLDQTRWPANARLLQADIITLGMCGVFLISARIRGRKIGAGQVRLGIGDNPTANLTLIVALAVVVAAYAILVRFSFQQNLPDLFSRFVPGAPWLGAFTIFLIVILAPL